MYGSVVKFRPGPADLPTFATLGIIDVHTINAIPQLPRPGARPVHLRSGRGEGRHQQDADAADRAAVVRQNADLLTALDTGLRRMDRLDPLIEGLDQYQQTAFNMLRSPKLREALDLSKEDPKRSSATPPQRAGQDALSERQPSALPAGPAAGRGRRADRPLQPSATGTGTARTSSPAGSRSRCSTRACRRCCEDLDDRGLLDSTIVLALGEMGRKPQVRHRQERRPRPLGLRPVRAGGRRRLQAAATSSAPPTRHGEQVTDKFYKVESFGRTLYHLLGIDPDTVVRRRRIGPSS